MSDLLEAAKAVIDSWDSPKREVFQSLGERFVKLRAAVERAEKQEAVGFREWWDAPPR
jgi:hypothetical protein